MAHPPTTERRGRRPFSGRRVPPLAQWPRSYRWLLGAALLLAAFGAGMLIHAMWSRPAAVADPHAAPQPADDPHAQHVHDHEDEPLTSMRELTVRPEVAALMNIEVAPVEQRHVSAVVRMVGKIDYDETRVRHVTAWVAGRIDRMFVDYEGIEIRQGDPLVEIYSEELIVAQEELLRLTRWQPEDDADRMARSERRPGTGGEIDLIEAARTKLRRLGLTDQQIREIEDRGVEMEHLTIHAPIRGTVFEKVRREGDRVAVGDRIYGVAELDHLWARMDAYEADLPWLRYGQPVEFTTEAYPGEILQGRIVFIDPVLNERTRTVKVRVNVPNPERKLKPDMFVRAVVRATLAEGGRVVEPDLAGLWACRRHPEVLEPEENACRVCGDPLVPLEELDRLLPYVEPLPPPLVIPVSAALVTGRRAIVYVQDPDAEHPTFEGREIVLGPRAGDYYLVKHGLAEGELVVMRGNMKIDSAIQLQARPSMLSPEGGPVAGHDHDHDHGNDHDHDDDHDEAMPEAPADPMPLPASVAQQFRALEEAAAEVAWAVRREHVPHIRESFRQFGQALDQVEGERLTGHASMVWNELHMLLRNDAVEGGQIKRASDARRVLDSLARDLRRVREQFDLDTDHPDEHRHGS